MTDESNKRITREDLKQPPGATTDHNQDGSPKTDRQIKWEQSVADLANSVREIGKKSSDKED